MFGPDVQALPGACALALLTEEMSLGKHLAHACLAQTRRHCLERVYWPYWQKRCLLSEHLAHTSLAQTRRHCLKRLYRPTNGTDVS